MGSARPPQRGSDPGPPALDHAPLAAHHSMADVHYLVGEDLALCRPKHPILNWPKTRDRGAVTCARCRHLGGINDTEAEGGPVRDAGDAS